MMSSKNSKLRVIATFAALAALALVAVSCRGFFPGTTYTSLAIEPATPQIPLNGTLSFQAWGTDSTTGARAQITSGASWYMSTGTTGSATIVSNTGVATGQNLGAVTTNVSYQGLTTSASGVVYLANISSICVSTSNTSGSCTPPTEHSSGGTAVNLYAIAEYTNGSNQPATQDITTSATWNVSGPDTTSVTCSTTNSPAVCTISSSPTTGSYTITVSYPQTSVTGTNTIEIP